MTIARPAHSKWQITCNKCGEAAEQPHNLTFQAVAAAIKELGWRAFKRFSKWAHHCPKCSGAKRAEAIAERWIA